MADTTITLIPATVVETDAVPIESILTIDAPLWRAGQAHDYLIILKVSVGTFQFAVGGNPGSGPLVTTTDDSVVLTVNNKNAKLHFLAVAQNDAFEIFI